jgi:hypothetical protein
MVKLAGVYAAPVIVAGVVAAVIITPVIAAAACLTKRLWTRPLSRAYASVAAPAPPLRSAVTYAAAPGGSQTLPTEPSWLANHDQPQDTMTGTRSRN